MPCKDQQQQIAGHQSDRIDEDCNPRELRRKGRLRSANLDGHVCDEKAAAALEYIAREAFKRDVSDCACAWATGTVSKNLEHTYVLAACACARTNQADKEGT